jgi:hypothetical protein
MKIKYIVLPIVLLILTLGSCKKALDMAPDGKLTMDQVFADNDKVGAFLNSCYTNMPVKGTRYYFWMRGPVDASDDAWDTDAEAEPSLVSGRTYNGDASASNHPLTNISADMGNGDYYARYWNAIRNASLFISRIDKATVSSEIDRKRWKAEAHLLRAYYYSELLKWFGPALPIEKDPYNFTDDFSKLKKESFYDVAKFVMSDCDVALATAELPWRITTDSEAGRVNKAMAEAIKSKMILFAASPLNNAGKDYWQEAYTVNKASLANLRAAGYALYNTVNFPQTYLSDVAFIGPNKNEKSALYNEYFCTTMAYSSSPVDKETIFQSRDGQGNIWNIDGIGAQDGYKSGTCPTQELVDAYETSDGQPVLNLASPYLDDNHLQPNYNAANTLYSATNPYANRDPRFYASIYYNGSKRKCFWSFPEDGTSPENSGAAGNRTRVITTYKGDSQTGIHPTVRKATRTGYFERKFLHPTCGGDNVVGGANFKLFRLGEVILNFAEAAVMAGQLAEATSAVNEIRTRAGMPNIPSSLSKDDLLLRVKNERRVELALEENRFFDIRRWTSPTGDLSKTDRWITAMEITRQAGGTFTYVRRNVRANERKNYTNKWLRLPIPLNEANALRGSTGLDWQNPGW